MVEIFHTSGIFEYSILNANTRKINEYAEVNGYKFYIINGEIKSKADLLNAFYRECNFPAYFGFNWDALKDCLTDFSFAPAQGYIFALADSKTVKKCLGSDFETFIHVFSIAIESWRQKEIKFILVLG